MAKKIINIYPQPGFQTQFLQTPADIAIGGGAAGAGKTFALLLESIRHRKNKDFGGIIFRRTYPEIMRQGGMWDESKTIYPNVGAFPNESKVRWEFMSGAKMAFSHLQYEKDLSAFQGAQIPFIAFDELTHFTKHMFFYLLTRNRSMCGVKPYIRATCNPDPDSWVADFISWWIDQNTGYPIPERAGKIRYVVRDGEAYIWGSTKEEVLSKAAHVFEDPMFEGFNKMDMVKSVTFIPGQIQDNKQLLSRNPAYLANLLSQDEETQLRLLKGNWKIRADKTSLFDPFAVTDMFTNDYRPKPHEKKYIIIDHARFGRDFCIIGTWHGWFCKRIDILPISDTNDIMKVVQELRSLYPGIPMSNILIDQDGIGVKDKTDCRIFQGNATPHKVNRQNQHYKNRKTQCYFMAAEKVNENNIFVDLDNIWFHGKGAPRRVTELFVSGRTQTVKQLIVDDLRTLKRENPDLEQRKQITNKENQKAILGRSPDFGDMFMMRADFEFIKEKKYMGTV